MKELIPIQDHNGKKAVDARLLHTFLESKQDFSTWIKNRIKKYGFAENQDYVIVPQNYGTANGGYSVRDEYVLSLDCAKELSMVEGNAKGKQARQYFIERDNQLKEVEQKPASQIDLIIQSAKMLKEQDERTTALESKVKVLEAKSTTDTNEFTIVGYASFLGISINLKQASSIGRKACNLCKARDIELRTIPDPRFGKVYVYPISILEEIFDLPLN